METLKCANCGSDNLMKNGTHKGGRQKYKCRDCGSEKAPIGPGQVLKPKTKNMGISVDEFMRKNDVETQMREAVKKLVKGTLFKRAQCVDEFGISKTTGYVDVLNADEFAQYRGNVTSDQQYFGHPEDIKMLKEKRLLK